MENQVTSPHTHTADLVVSERCVGGIHYHDKLHLGVGHIAVSAQLVREFTHNTGTHHCRVCERRAICTCPPVPQLIWRCMTTCITIPALGWACLAVPGGHGATQGVTRHFLIQFSVFAGGAEGRHLRPVTTQVLGQPAQALGHLTLSVHQFPARES